MGRGCRQLTRQDRWGLAHLPTPGRRWRGSKMGRDAELREQV